MHDTSNNEEDFTCADTLAPCRVINTSRFPGAAAEELEREKLRKYQFLEPHYLFMPVAIETMGVYAPLAKKLVNWVGSKLERVTKDTRARSFFKHRISMAIQRGNAAAILGKLHGCKNFE